MKNDNKIIPNLALNPRQKINKEKKEKTTENINKDLKELPKTINEFLEETYQKIKRFDERNKEYDYSKKLKKYYHADTTGMSDLDKALHIYLFVSLNIREKKDYQNKKKYDSMTIKESIDKLNRKKEFNQDNFLQLIDTCKMLIENQKEDDRYINQLKQEIILLNRDRNAAIEQTKDHIKNLQNECKRLIQENGKLMIGQSELYKKNDKIREQMIKLETKEQENNKLEKKLKSNEIRFKNEIKKEENINRKKLQALVYENKSLKNTGKDLLDELNNYKSAQINFQNSKVENAKLSTENEKLACHKAQLLNENYNLKLKNQILAKKLENAKQIIKLYIIY